VSRENFREYLEQIVHDGYTVRHDEHGSDPDLIDPGGNPIETWRTDYPYDDRMDRDKYEDEKHALQIELLKFQDWAQATGTKHVIFFEVTCLSSAVWPWRPRPQRYGLVFGGLIGSGWGSQEGAGVRAP
jgi:hypothetical protein